MNVEPEDQQLKPAHPAPAGAGGRLFRPLTPDLAEYLRDESRSVGHAASISFPASEDEIRTILQAAWQEGSQVTIQGARTGLAAGAVPFGGHILNLSRLNRIRGMRVNSRGRFCLRIEPGIVLSQLRKLIADKKFDLTGWDAASLAAYENFRLAPEQFFSPDPTEISASLGGMAACNASGARSYFYGPVRNHLTALRIVLSDGQTLALRRGEVFAAGRELTLATEQGQAIQVRLPSYRMPATKSASGYHIADDMDAIDLFIGSDGTLGVITELEVELLPLPPVIWGTTFFFRREDDAIDFVLAARDEMRGPIAALEYFDERVLAILRAQKEHNPAFAQLPLPEPGFQCAIYIELHNEEEAKATAQLFRLGELMTLAGGREQDTWVARTAFDHDRLIFFRHAAPESVNKIIDQRRQTCPAITKLGTDMSVPDGCLREVLTMYHRMLREKGLEYAIWGHIGNNHVHVNILPRNEEDYRQGKALYKAWAAEIVRMGGSVSAEHGIGKLKADFLALMYGRTHVAEMAALKRGLDARYVLGVGNLFAPEDQL